MWTPEIIALFAGLGLATFLVCMAAAVYYAPRPIYNADQFAKQGIAEVTEEMKLREVRHSADAAKSGTVRLGPFPPTLHPRN